MAPVPTGPFTAMARAAIAAAVCGDLAAALTQVAARLAAELDPAAIGGRGLEGGVALMVLAAGGVALGVVAVGCLLTAVGAAARLGGRTLAGLERTAARLTPAVLRRTIAVGVGTGLLLGVAGAATAVEPEEPDTSTTVQQDADVSGAAQAGDAARTDAAPGLNLGWQVTSGAVPGSAPDGPPTTTSPTALPLAGNAAARPGGGAPDEAAEAPSDPDGAPGAATATAAEGVSTAAPDPAPAPATADPSAATTAPTWTTPTTAVAPATVTVHAGDTLWAIAAAHLPAGSTSAEVAAAWPRWYEVNRVVVGDDPDVIHPGQVLTAPVEEQP